MPFIWTTENVINLIEQYRNAECLWNPLAKNYKDRYKKQDLWVEISTGIGATVDEVRKKIKNLVAQYYREKKKYRAYQKSGAGTYFISKWFAYKYLEFLSDKNAVRHCSVKGIAAINEPHSPNNSEYDADNDDENEGETENNETQDTTQFSTDDQLSIQQENTQAEIHQDKTGLKSDNMEQKDNGVKQQKEIQISIPRRTKTLDVEFKRPKKRHSTQNLNKESDERQEEAYMFLKELQQKQHLRDNFTIFGEHVASKIRRLKTEYAQNTVEHLIGNILWEASTGKYDQPYPYHGSSQLGYYSSSSSVTPTATEYSYVPSPFQSPQMLQSTDTGIASDPMSGNIQEPLNRDDIIYNALSSL